MRVRRVEAALALGPVYSVGGVRYMPLFGSVINTFEVRLATFLHYFSVTLVRLEYVGVMRASILHTERC